MTLRPFQQDGVDQVHTAFETYRRVLYVLATGGGKSHVIQNIVKRAYDKGNCTHLLVHRDKLLQQLHDRLLGEIADDQIGWVKAGRKSHDRPIQLVSIQSWKRRQASLPTPQLIITDEAHRATAPSYLAHQAYYPKAYSLGVTATPCILTGAGLDTAYDYLVQGPQVQWLVDHQFLAPLEYKRFSPIIGNLGSVASNGEFKLAAISKKIKPEDYSPALITAYEQYIPGKATLVFAIDCFHAQRLAELYTAAGIPSLAYTSEHTPEQQQAALQAFLDGDILCLMSVEIFNEGLDLPFVEAVQLARPTDSLRIFLQQVGRVIRYVKGKIGWVLDHVDNYGRHGHPLAPRRWTLAGELGELERKAKIKEKQVKSATQRQWEILGFSSKQAQKLLSLDKSEYWANWLTKTIGFIEMKNYRPGLIFVKLKAHSLDPPWTVYEAASKWAIRKKVSPGAAWAAYKERYGHYPNDQRRDYQETEQWKAIMEDIDATQTN